MCYNDCSFIYSFIHKEENPTTACSFIDSGACYELVEWCKEEEELLDGHRPVAALVLRPFRPLAVTAVCWPQLQAVALVAIAQLHALLTGSHESMWMDLPRSSLALDWMESISLNLIASLNQMSSLIHHHRVADDDTVDASHTGTFSLVQMVVGRLSVRRLVLTTHLADLVNTRPFKGKDLEQIDREREASTVSSSDSIISMVLITIIMSSWACWEK